jgi:CheY-like chemotaxis protein
VRARPQRKPVPTVAHARSSKPVLIVDDNEDIREALSAMLEVRGYETICADNGATALALLRSHHIEPCLILLDLSMPVMDGATFRKEQQQDAALSGLPVVLYSGICDPTSEAEALGVRHYFKKPLDLEKLVAIVATHC